MISSTDKRRERATLATAKRWLGHGVIVQAALTAIILGFGVVTPLYNPMTVLFMIFMVVSLGLGWLSYNSALSALDKNPKDNSSYVGEVTWAELLTTVVVYILVSAFLSWMLSDNLQRVYLNDCWEQASATEACTP